MAILVAVGVVGSILAFPGGMIGAFFSGLFYKRFGKHRWAVIGEVFGTGIVSSLFSVPFARLLMGSSAGALYFMPSFLISSIGGSLLGWLIISRIPHLEHTEKNKKINI